ncbi:MAG: substrate-binding domain-containing protein [Ardenticatenia bacterium]|nr:substrate-binding domain-containing protein [Ardenticatenia bacterium]
MTGEISFIGRHRELAKVEVLFDLWGTNQAVRIEGVGGIGKTRFLREIQSRAEGYRIPADRNLTITLVQELTTSEWSQEFIRGARSMAAELGVRLIETDAEYDVVKMKNDFQCAIDESPDAIVVSLGTNEILRPQFDLASARNIKVITFDNGLTDLSGVDCRVEQDDVHGARDIAKHLVDEK